MYIPAFDKKPQSPGGVWRGWTSPASSCDPWQGQGTSRRLAPLPSQGSVRRAASVMRAARRERGARLNLRGVAGVKPHINFTCINNTFLDYGIYRYKRVPILMIV